MLKLVTAEQMRAIERAAAGELGIDTDQLVSRAGKAVAGAVQRLIPDGQVTILVGPGNNGNDGLTAARLLRGEGRSIACYTFRRHDACTDVGTLLHAEEDAGYAALGDLVARSSIVVDAILGTGQSRPPAGLLADVLAVVEGRMTPGSVGLSVDVPTGVNADSGAVPARAFRADVTICMGFAKRGIALFPGASYAGRVEVAELNLPRELAGEVQVSCPCDADIAALLPRRSPDGNKGASGRLLIVGGSREYLGAPMLAAMAAYRAGSGLVELGMPGSIQFALSAHGLEPVYRPLEDVRGQLSLASLPGLREPLERAHAVVFGPGMGLSDQTISFAEALLEAMDEETLRAVVVDADALNSLARLGMWWKTRTPLVVTPHPGEMSRLTGLSIDDVQSDRIQVAQRFAGKWNVIVVLKGARTVIADPAGRVIVNPTGGPNLATAGTGDVLSGIIGSLLAQGCDPWNAAVAGVYLHGRAGDILQEEKGDIGTIASDVVTVLPAARLSIFQGAGSDR